MHWLLRQGKKEERKEGRKEERREERKKEKKEREKEKKKEEREEGKKYRKEREGYLVEGHRVEDWFDHAAVSRRHQDAVGTHPQG